MVFSVSDSLGSDITLVNSHLCSVIILVLFSPAVAVFFVSNSFGFNALLIPSAVVYSVIYCVISFPPVVVACCEGVIDILYPV